MTIIVSIRWNANAKLPLTSAATTDTMAHVGPKTPKHAKPHGQQVAVA